MSRFIDCCSARMPSSVCRMRSCSLASALTAAMASLSVATVSASAATVVVNWR